MVRNLGRVSRTPWRPSRATLRSWRRRNCPQCQWKPRMSTDTLLPDLDLAFSSLRRAREAFVADLTPHEIGTITSVSTGIATVSGLRGAGFEELIQFPE